MSSPDTVLGRFVQRIEKTYPLPPFSQRAWAAIEWGATGPAGKALEARPLIEAMAQNPTWTAGLFATIRHPRFGGFSAEALSSKLVESIERPVLAALLYGFGLPEAWFQDLEPAELQRYWTKTLLRSAALRLASVRSPRVDSQGLLPAAMLADFGMLVLYQELKQTYRDFVTQAVESGQDLYQMELESLGFDHRILAARLLDGWPVPGHVGAAIGRFHVVGPDWEAHGQSPPQAIESLRLGLLHVTDEAADWLCGHRSPVATGVVRFTRDALDWDLATTKTWLRETQELAEHLATSFGLPTQGFRLPIPVAKLEQAWSELEAGTAIAEATRSAAVEPFTSDPAGEHSATPEPDSVRSAAPGSGELPIPRGFVDPSTAGKIGSSDSPWSRGGSSPAAYSGPRAAATYPAAKPAAGGGTAVIPASPGDWAADPALGGLLQSQVEFCRARRQPLSLLLAQVDGFESLLFGGSIDEVYAWQERLFAGLSQVVESEGGRVLEIGDGQFALILPGIERTSASRVGQEILRIVRRWSDSRLEAGKSGLSLSLGCAATDTPPRNFRGELLVEAAQRCLEYVQRGSGNSIKSIEVF